MKKTTLLLLFSLLLTLGQAQNALQSVELINRLKSDPLKLDSLFKELGKYVEFKKGIRGIDLANPFNFKSDYLQKYLVGTLSSSLILQTAVSQTANLPAAFTSGRIKDSLVAYGIPLSGTFKDIIKAVEDTSNYSSVNHKIFPEFTKLIIDSMYAMARKNYVRILGTSNQGDLDKINTLFKSFSADSKPSFNINNVFEIQNLSSLKNSVKLPSESDIIDALAIFLVNRVKEESVIAFVEHVNKNIDKLQPLPCLFKNTTKELAGYSPGQAAQFGSITQKAIAIDLAKMPDNIADCGFCGKTNAVKQYKDFTDFFNDISGGVDLITNISYYADKAEPSNYKFTYVLQLLNFVNKYYSNIFQKGDVTQTWLSPDFIDAKKRTIDNKNDTALKLSLALVYEKEKEVFDEFLKTRFKCTSLDNFFSKKDSFDIFKVNFKEMLFSLHRLDSYWQSNRSDGKAIVDMTVYKRKISDALEDVYAVMNYPPDTFPLKNPLYDTYLKAKAAVSEQDIQGIVFHSQQLLDLLKCYEIKLPGFKLPRFEFKRILSCPDTNYTSRKQIMQLKGDSATKISDFNSIHTFFMSSNKMASLSAEIFCNREASRAGKKWTCDLFRGRFTHYKKTLEGRIKRSQFDSAMHYKFRPCPLFHPFLFTFHYPDWKLATKLVKIRKLHFKQLKLDALPEYSCYLKEEQKLQNKNSFGSSRREVSKLLNFFTDLSKSKDSKQLSQIVEKYAEPAQSYRIKRFNHFSWDINAYPGVYVGIETRAGSGNSPYAYDSISKIVTGITAPIGISFSWAGRVKFTCDKAGKYPAYINKKGDIKSFKGGCFTASLLIIDIGAVVSYRFSHDTSQALPKEVSFSQVIAPGFYLGYGLPNLPLTINAGIQYTPQLRTFDNENGKMFDTYRLSLSLCYDIPLLNISNTSKRSKRIVN